MACSSGSNIRKKHRQLSLVDMCKMPKTDQNTSESTSHDEQELRFDIEQEQTLGHIELVDLDQEIVTVEADLVNSLCPAKRYVPNDPELLPVRYFGKNRHIRSQTPNTLVRNLRFFALCIRTRYCHMLSMYQDTTKPEISEYCKIEPAFTNINIGFCIWKKAIEKFNDHKNSRQHKLALEVQLFSKGQDSISTQLDASIMDSQQQLRSFLVKVITSLKFLGECALPIRGHVTDSG